MQGGVERKMVKREKHNKRQKKTVKYLAICEKIG